MIQPVGIALTMGASKDDFDGVVTGHPLMLEGLVTMKIPVRRG